MKIKRTIKWRNMGLFAVSFGAAMWGAYYLQVSIPKVIVFYGLGAWFPWTVVRLGWHE